MKKLILCLLVIVSSIGLSAQNSKFQEARNYLSGAYFYAGYHNNYFLNPTYRLNKQNGDIRYKWGAALGYRFIIMPVIIDLSYWGSRYYVNNDVWGFENKTARQNGLEVSASLILTPMLKHISPYIGFGGQASSLIVRQEDDYTGEDAITPLVSRVNTSGLLWKAGMLFNFNIVSIAAEYKQSFATNNYSFGQLDVTIGLRFKEFYK